MTIPPVPSKKPDPSPTHIRQSFWQILLPIWIIFAVYLALGIVAIVITAGGSPVAPQWAALSGILVMIPLCICGLIPLAILGGSVFGMTKGLPAILVLMRKLQDLTEKILAFLRKIADKAAAPIIKTEKFAASVKSFWTSLNHRKPNS